MRATSLTRRTRRDFRPPCWSLFAESRLRYPPESANFTSHRTRINMKQSPLSAYSSSTQSFVDRGGQLFIAGQFRASRFGATLPVVDPASGETISSIPAGTAADIDEAVAAAKRASENEAWSRMGPEP